MFPIQSPSRRRSFDASRLCVGGSYVRKSMIPLQSDQGVWDAFWAHGVVYKSELVALRAVSKGCLVRWRPLSECIQAWYDFSVPNHEARAREMGNRLFQDDDRIQEFVNYNLRHSILSAALKMECALPLITYLIQERGHAFISDHVSIALKSKHSMQLVPHMQKFDPETCETSAASRAHDCVRKIVQLDPNPALWSLDFILCALQQERCRQLLPRLGSITDASWCFLIHVMYSAWIAKHNPILVWCAVRTREMRFPQKRAGQCIAHCHLFRYSNSVETIAIQIAVFKRCGFEYNLSYIASEACRRFAALKDKSKESVEAMLADAIARN